MNKPEKAEQLYKEGYLCSQSVFAAFCKDYGLDEQIGLKLSKFLGFGYLFRGDLCGAVSAAVMLYSLKYASSETYSDTGDDVFYHLAKEHMKKFEQKHGSCLCCELLGESVSTAEGIENIREKGYFNSRCPSYVKDSAEILDEAIRKMERLHP